MYAIFVIHPLQGVIQQDIVLFAAYSSQGPSKND
jgi:hypothetical protein